MNNVANNAAATTERPMRIGRALHMDLTRASDRDLERAFAVLDGYMNEGKASAYTMAKFDDRIEDIFAEQDRRAGAKPVYVERMPLSHYFGSADDADADESEPDGAPAGEDADGLTPAERAEGRKDADALRETFAETGLVPGLTSAI